MGNLLVNRYLAIYIISSQINDLVAIVDMFSDNISDLEDNVYVRQNDVLVKILKNLKSMRKKEVSLSSIYSVISDEDMELIENLEIDVKIAHNVELSDILGVAYFDKEKFMEILDGEIEEFSSKYNLRANDDFNKMKEFLISIRASLKASDDMLATLANQYEFFMCHGKDSLSPEYISLYGSKMYKDDLLRKIIDKYNVALTKSNENKTNKGKKR